MQNVDTARIGDWMQTFTGRCFYPMDPRPEDVCIEDIAHSLSMMCRYGGHSTRFYSVAEHSVLVSRYVDPEYALWGLLHDAAEAYSSDIPRPLKRNLPDWKPMEDKIMAAVCERFGLAGDEPPQVKAVDLAITSDEKAAIMAPCERQWEALPAALGAWVQGYGPEDAKRIFLEAFDALTNNA